MCKSINLIIKLSLSNRKNSVEANISRPINTHQCFHRDITFYTPFFDISSLPHLFHYLHIFLPFLSLPSPPAASGHGLWVQIYQSDKRITFRFSLLFLGRAEGHVLL